MRFTIPTLALFSALATAMPTVSTAPPPTSPHPNKTLQAATEGDGRGATIWSEQKYAGQSVAIPGNEYCADLGMIMPNLEGKGRSIMVEAGYSCQFYTYVAIVCVLLW
jgi:hypothetical protein